MLLVSSILARGLALTDAVSQYFIVAGATVGNYSNCGNLPVNVSVTPTSCGQEVFTVIRMLLIDNPLSLVNFWMPALAEILNGMSAVARS